MFRYRKKADFPLCLVLLILLSCPATARCETIKLRVEGDSLTAKFEDAPVKQIVQEIQEKKTIWVKGTENLPETSLSMEFEDLPFREGLERILSSTNYCLIYGQGGNLDGVIILSNPSAKTDTSRKAGTSSREKTTKRSSRRSTKSRR